MKKLTPAFLLLACSCSGLNDEDECCAGWNPGAYLVEVDARFEQDVGPGAGAAVLAAFDAWAAVADLPTFEFAFVDDAAFEPDGRNSVLFDELSAPYEDNLGATAYYSEGGVNVEGDVAINSLHDWAVLVAGPDELPDPPECGGFYDLQSVVTHEVGHFLGLVEESSDEDDTMFLETRLCSIRKRTLTSNDVARIQALYGAP